MNIQQGYIEWYKSLSMVPCDLRVANNTFTFTSSKKFSKKKNFWHTKHAYKMIRLKSEINYAARA